MEPAGSGATSTRPFSCRSFSRQPVEEHGPYSAICGTVQMDGIFQDGFHTPLTTTQVAGLFHAGCLSRHTGGNGTEETEGQMIDDLLPLLKYRTSRQFTRHLPAARRPRPFRLSLPTAILRVFVGAAASVIIGCLFFTARPSMAWPISTSVASPSSVLENKQTKNSIARGRTPLGGSGPLVGVVSAAVMDTQSYVLAVNALHRDRHARRNQMPAEEGREAVASR